MFVDDLIPCDALGRPLFARSKDPNELWPLLLEKAYAKCHGCYEALITGQVERGAAHFGVGRTIPVTLNP